MRSSSRRRVAGVLLNVARVGQAEAFFGNVYEAVVKVPHWFAHERSLVGRQPLRFGDPTLYFVPAGPVALAASVGALVAGGADRRWLAASTAASTAAGLVTAYVVTQVNKRLFLDANAPSAEERDALLRNWYRLNAVRAALLGTAWFASERARQVMAGSPADGGGQGC
jgi:hypothetical protein